MSKRLQILTAIVALLQATRPTATVRGMSNFDAKPDEVDPEGEAIVRAGDPGQPLIDLSPPVYHWDHTIPVELRHPGSKPTSAQVVLDQWMVAIGAAIAADPTLGGLCAHIEASAPMEGTADEFGAAPVGWADFQIVATYQTSGPLA